MGSLRMRSFISLRSGGDALPCGLVAPVVMIRPFVFEAIAVTIEDVVRRVRRCGTECQDVPRYIAFAAPSFSLVNDPIPQTAEVASQE